MTDRRTDGRTDRRTDRRTGKNNMSPDPVGGRHNNSKNTQARVMVLVHDTSSHRGLQVYQVSMKNLKRFSSYRVDKCRTDRRTDGRTDGRMDGWTDGQTDARGKTICLPTLKWGDITNKKNCTSL